MCLHTTTFHLSSTHVVVDDLIGSHFPYSIGVTVSFDYLVVGILTTSSSDTLGQVPEWQLFLSKHFIIMLLTDGIDESFFYKERKYAGKRH